MKIKLAALILAVIALIISLVPATSGLFQFGTGAAGDPLYEGTGAVTGAVPYFAGSSEVGGNTVAGLTWTATQQATGRAPTIVVAASDATAAEKAQADYVLTGTADQTNINTYLTTVSGAGGGKVHFTTGTIHQTGMILVPSNITIEGCGIATVFYLDSNSNCPSFANTDYTNASGGNTEIHLKNFKIDGNRTGNTSDIPSPPITGINYTTSVILFYVTKSSVDNLILVSSPVAGIEADNSNNITIQNCTISDTRADAIGFETSYDCIVTNNILIGPGVDGAPSGVEIQDDSYNITVSNNLIEGAWVDSGIGLSVHSAKSAVYNVTISGNNLAGITKVGVSIYGRTDGGANITDVTITGNTFNIAAADGLGVDTALVQDISIIGNVFECDSYTAYYGTAIVLEETSGVIISCNTFHRIGYKGVRLQDNANYVTISNNIFDYFKFGIYYLLAESPPPVGLVIIGNQFYNIQSAGIVDEFRTYHWGSIIKDNIGYLAEGEIRNYSGSLTAGTVGNAVIAWQNPEAQSMMVSSNLKVTTAGTATSVGQMGLATTVSVLENCEDVWTDGTNGTNAVNTTYVERGINCIAVTAGASIANGNVMAYKNGLGDMDVSTATHITLKVRSDHTLAAGDLALQIAEDDAVATPAYTLNLPAITANATTLVCLNINAGAAAGNTVDALHSIGLEYNANAHAGTIIYLDDIRAITVGATMFQAVDISPASVPIIYSSLNVTDAGTGDAKPIHLDYKNNDSSTLHDTLVMVSVTEASTNLVGTYYITGQGE